MFGHRGSVDVQLLAQMGGPAPGSTDSPGCCCVCLLPLVAVLALLAMYRNAAWPAVLALVSVGLSFLAIWNEVDRYQPSDGWNEVDKQEARRELVRALAVPLALAGFSLCWVLGAWLGRSRTSPPQSPSGPSDSPDGDV
ncbi:MAG TPA: hypothetical protein VGE74_16975 [Gemmata sp.]